MKKLLSKLTVIDIIQIKRDIEQHNMQYISNEVETIVYDDNQNVVYHLLHPKDSSNKKYFKRKLKEIEEQRV